MYATDTNSDSTGTTWLNSAVSSPSMKERLRAIGGVPTPLAISTPLGGQSRLKSVQNHPHLVTGKLRFVAVLSLSLNCLVFP